MLKFLGLIYVVSGVIVGDVMASSIEDLQQHYTDVVTECISENPISPSDLESMAQNKTPNSPEVTMNCLFACAFKKTGMMDDEGNLSVEGVRKITEKYLADNPEIMKKSEQFTDACKSVNDEPVTDGAKGCDRARLIYNCCIEKSPDFDILGK